MTSRRRFRWLPLAIALFLLLAIRAATVSPARPRALSPVPVLSGIEAAGTRSIARDCGYSQPLPDGPGRSLWLFCDTPVYVRAGRSATDSRRSAGQADWRLGRFIGGSTAAEGPSAHGGPPGRLTEIATPGTGGTARPGGAPAPFLPAPSGLFTPIGLPCGLPDGAYPASWITGVARIPSSPNLLITFNNYCVLTGPSPAFVPEGFGLVEYDPAANTLSNEVTVFAGSNWAGTVPAELLGSPVFYRGDLYLFGPTCTNPGSGKCSGGRIFMARVSASPLAWTSPLSYMWWTGDPGNPWTPNPFAAASVIPGARPSAVSVGDFSAAGHGIVLVEQNDIGGDFSVYEARSPASRWRKLMSGRVPCRSGRGYANFCRAIIGHPELSTPAKLTLTYFNPVAGVSGHVMAVSVRW